MAKSNQWFDVDRAGLRALLAGRSKAFILRELVQNCFDEPGVTGVHVSLKPVPGKAMATLVVHDDAPEGFSDLRHAFTLYADNRKRANPEKRGRFNYGEKQVLALCGAATIETTTGSVIFHKDGTRTQRRNGKTEVGSVFRATLSMTRAEIKEALTAARTFIVPLGIKMALNGERLPAREPVVKIETTLQTEAADAEGVMRSSRRRTEVALYEPLEGETPTLYEMGLPVCETGDRWHYNVNQRVPLTVDREHVRPAYLRDLRAEVLNRMHGELEAEEVAEPWVQDALTDERVETEAVRAVVVGQHGDRAFVPVPGDRKANERAMAMGYRPVSGGSYGQAAWENIRGAEALRSSIEIAGKTTMADFEPILATDWTEDMRRVSRLAQFIADACLNISVNVRMIRSPKASTVADYADRTIRFNVARLGKRWFRPDNLEAQVDLIVHEAGHEGGGHLEMGYHKALTKMAARLALMEPTALRGI